MFLVISKRVRVCACKFACACVCVCCVSVIYVLHACDVRALYEMCSFYGEYMCPVRVFLSATL